MSRVMPSQVVQTIDELFPTRHDAAAMDNCRLAVDGDR